MLFIYIRTGIPKSKDINKKTLPVSVIICARNEAENLSKNLPSILTQNYPDFEVVVVDDASTDDTLLVLSNLKEQYPNLYFTSLKEAKYFLPGKKLPLTVGIKAAKNDIVLLTDADCTPKTENWIREMASQMNDDVTFVLGYGGYKKYKGLLNKIIRFDTIQVAMQYITFAKIGLPYMGVGRNLMYRKSFFLQSRGFANMMKTISGDDDLFVNKHATKKNTKIEISAESFTYSEPKRTFTDWKYQKKRHFSTSGYYKLKHKFLLGLDYLSKILFFVLSIVLISFNKFIFVNLILIFFRLIVFHIVIYRACKTFDEKSLIKFGTFFDIVIPIVHIWFAFARLFEKKTYKWK